MVNPNSPSIFLKLLLSALILPFLIISCGGGGGGGGAPTGITVAPAGGGAAAGGGGAAAGGGGAAAVADCAAANGGCNVTWNQSGDGRVTGYRIYIGSTNPVSVANAEFFDDVAGVATVLFNFDQETLATADAVFTSGSTVFIAISAIGANGIESPLSAQVSIDI